MTGTCKTTTSTLGLGAGVKPTTAHSTGVKGPTASTTAPKPSSNVTTPPKPTKPCDTSEQGKLGRTSLGVNSTRVFVYGTLKKGHCNDSALRGAEYLGRFALHGRYVMLDVGWYPALVKSTTAELTNVYGEVWRISEEHLAAMDLIEGHPHYYVREKVYTPWKSAWVYMLPTEHLKRELPVVEGNVWDPMVGEQEWIDASKKAG